jgi:L-ascorbate metabolism protein UlaG (beta-lactamase superfamily)
MRRLSVSVLAALLLGWSATAGAGEPKLPGDRVADDKGELIVHPVSHATFLLQSGGKTVYVDPVGGGKLFASLPKPDLVLVTHLHFDHFDPATLDAVLPAERKTPMVVPPAVVEKVPESLLAKAMLMVLANGEKAEVAGLTIEAVPAYNTTPGKETFHPKGRDNGYVLSLGGKRVYIAGDTEDTPEMRALKDIDVAFLPMNQPYTMSIQQAAEAIRQFKPKIIYPYHFRNGDKTKADLKRLKELVGEHTGVEVRVLDWYPER